MRLGICPQPIQRWRRLCIWPWRFLPSSGAMKARSTLLLAELAQRHFNHNTQWGAIEQLLLFVLRPTTAHDIPAGDR